MMRLGLKEIGWIPVALLVGHSAVFAAGLKVPGDGDGGGLKTDPELNVLLERAEQFASQKRYDLASELWQKVIDDSNDAVMTKPEWVQESLNHQYRIYKPVQDEIEQTLSALPPEALKVYRLRADGEAASVLAAARNQDQYELALGEVVRRYFLSSMGDDAAYELAGLHLDRYESLPALRLLEKVLKHYPEPSVSKTEMQMRQVVAYALSGNADAASASMEALRASSDGDVPPELTAWLEAGGGMSSGVQVASDASQWAMPFGNASHTGTAPSIDLGSSTNGLTLAWQQKFVLTLPQELEGIVRQKESIEEKVPELLKAWRAVDWMPTGQVLIDGGRIYFKKDDRLVCLSGETGEVDWMGFRNGFAGDGVSTRLRQFGNRGLRVGGAGQEQTTGPLDPDTLQSFNDHVSQGMTLVDNKVITLEGRPLDLTAPSSDDANTRFGWSRESPTRKRENWMVAYHAGNGKLKWYRTAGELGGENESSACFLGAPVPYGSLLYTTVLEQNSLWLYAVNVADGKTAWRKFLCDEEPGGVSRFSAPSVAIAGGEVYVSTGAGLAFGLDAISGVLRLVCAVSAQHQCEAGQFILLYSGEEVGWVGTGRFDFVGQPGVGICFRLRSDSVGRSRQWRADMGKCAGAFAYGRAGILLPGYCK